ncbi:MAG TPA: deoxyribonuclease HsdR [Bacteroidales bacterium]|nr:MAG: deoxyribonuclease HsdR [Bacteroidetes bacterium GWF2_33_38]OFY89292.1 MAG: deoxyribonuclease HsdR [Bacteroidetes bacterium RIFOXYA2_FULL_33_7]HBF88040.1 deoxyribonuclease HsdR [Bacteroidales bacterium]
MTFQPEATLENNFVTQLDSLGHKFVAITCEAELLANLKSQLEKHNQIQISDKEFEKILNHLNKGNVFERAKILRDKMHLLRDNGESTYIEFLNKEHWCQNQFQVTRQVSVEGKYLNRYDVTILINGLPLVHIELKRRGVELKEAFNQINRYQRHSFSSSHGLFNYVQIFIISNGVNTKYYANNKTQTFKQTFYWADVENSKITNLEQFASVFLEPCHVSKMICQYIVLSEVDKILMVLRPYQYYATEAIIERVKHSRKNGYIWHTTGSGKTLTSFKASQILKDLPKVHKVVFVVDRKDLDYQTTKEFNSFSKGSVDGTDNTQTLVNQLSDDTKLIVTTIQKLNTAISKKKYLSKMEQYRQGSALSPRIIFIFDECHRSQFGETHNRIKSFFKNPQMFGFTGTPIFAENAVKNELGMRTTKELFDECLHKYVITDAIRDDNVLKFSIEYVGRYRRKDKASLVSLPSEIDIEVEDIDKEELLTSPERCGKIADYIIANHSRKTHGKEFTAMFCVSSVDALIQYYNIFKKKKENGEHKLKIATIFSYNSNEDDKDATGFIPDDLDMVAEPQAEYGLHQHSRESLDDFIEDYNQMFNTKFSTKDSQSFYNYYNDIAKMVKNKQVDMLLVVNMFLTGFDSKFLNTLYVDKNLKYHGLIQAFSRTNRIVNEQKSQGNIVCFRNLKQNTDDAIALFSNKDAKDVILMQPLEDYIDKFNEALQKLKEITPSVDSVNNLPSETEEFEFVKAFRELMRLKNTLTTFSDFTFDALEMEEQEFEDYKSKYLDIHDKVRKVKEKVSILDDVDFELELIHRDEVNVAYILNLLIKMKLANPEEKDTKRKEISDLLSGEAQLRSKRELIEKFIEENLLHITEIENVPEEFEKFWGEERKNALIKLSEEENLVPEKLQSIIDNYLFTERKPLNDEIVDSLKSKPKILERKNIVERIIDKIVNFVDTFVEGMAG